jgi:tRNA-splicing ligase RtcB
MKRQDLINVGIRHDCLERATQAIKIAAKDGRFHGITPRKLLKDVAESPDNFLQDKHFADLAQKLKEQDPLLPLSDVEFAQWGSDIDENTLEQMRTACELPITLGAAIMPDGHLGYGLPIGGVLATDNVVIPFAVGVDISCRMRLSIIDTPVELLEKELKNGGAMRRGDRLSEALQHGTRFGIGCTWEVKKQHDVMDMDWDICKTTKSMKDTAWKQLGTSGSGNHFVEIGILTIQDGSFGKAISSGKYLAILSHSGSRGVGAQVCKYYSDIATSKFDKRYGEKYRKLAWLSLDSEEGQEYWNAMTLMAEYAKGNHDIIHDTVINLLGASMLAKIENNHNLAWKETYNGKEMVVHRKGATPSGEGVMGIIPGSMASPCYVVRGKGNPKSFNSASHGAGRKMSRTEARNSFNWPQWNSFLKEKGVRLISAGLDEVPGAYKDIDAVVAAQEDLVDVVARFDPKIVKMSEDGKSED